MTTLLEAAKNLIAALDLDRHDVGDWPDASREAYLELKQAIEDEKVRPEQHLRRTLARIASTRA